MDCQIWQIVGETLLSEKKTLDSKTKVKQIAAFSQTLPWHVQTKPNSLKSGQWQTMNT